MKNDEFFEDLKELNFDIAEPNAGHEDRFLQKLNKNNPKKTSNNKGKLRTLWFTLSGVAAAILITMLAFSGILNSTPFAKETDLAKVSPQLKETQDFYSMLIEKEVKSLKSERTPETNAIINDAMQQMETLEKEYRKLKKDLLESGQDKRVIHAMITNFQQRIDLLNQVLAQIETIKQLKKQNHETTII